MKFILLGTGPGMPNLETHQSGLYVKSGDKHLLFDCGEGTSRRLLRHGLSGEMLDAIFISHYHPDHVSGLFMVLQMLYLQKRQRQLQLFLPERPAVMLEMLNYLYTFPAKLSFPLQILDCHEAELYHDDVEAIPTDHLRNYEEYIHANQHANQMNSYAFKISSEQGDLVYTSDINTTDCILPALRNCHTVIVDALHPEAAQILKLQYAEIERVILNHGISKELLSILSNDHNVKYEVAVEDQSYSIN